MKASRRSLLTLAVVPVWVFTAAVFLSIWPWRTVAGHLLVYALAGVVLAEICLYGFQKIPFTCSYLPGKSNVQLALSAVAPIMLLTTASVEVEMRALGDLRRYAGMVAVLGAAAVCARWRTARRSRSEDAVMKFVEVAPPTVQVLGLYRDGFLTVEPAPAPGPEQ